MLHLLTSLNLKGWHLSKWMKEEQKNYFSIVIESKVRGINVARRKFYIDYEEEEDQELEPSQYLDLEETTPNISCHTFADTNTPQSLKIEWYIKKKKVTMLIDSGSTHNFINYKLSKYLNWFVFIAPEFQVIIAYRGCINCYGKCHSIKLNMGEYLLDSPMISIQMGCGDVVLGVL